MKYIRNNNKVFVKFDKREELVSSLLSLLKKENITAGNFSAIGAIQDPVLGYFNTETASYEKKNFSGDYELVSLLGNIGLKDNEVTTHIHASIADKNLNLYGGHLFSCIVAVTTEVFIDIFPKKLERIYDTETKLNLLTVRS